MNKSNSIDGLFKRVSIIKGLTISVLSVFVMLMALYLQQLSWQKKYFEDYKHISIRAVTRQFDDLRGAAAGLLQPTNISQLVVQNQPLKLRRYLNVDVLAYADIDIALIQHLDGSVFSVIDNTLDIQTADLVTLHRPNIGGSFDATVDSGLDFIDGRVFMYVKIPLLEKAQTVNQVGVVTVLREVTSKTLRQLSYDIGYDYNFRYAAAGQRVTQVSYKNGFTLLLKGATQIEDKTVAEYELMLPDGRIQPSNFYISFDKQSFVSWQSVCLLIALLSSISLVAWVTWNGMKRKLIIPIRQILRSMSMEKSGAFQLKSEHTLPMELQRIYTKFNQLYSDKDHQSEFSRLLVDAIGDIIITVDSDGIIDYVNPAAVEWFSVDPKVLIGQPLDLLITNIQDDTPDVSTWIYRAKHLQRRTETKAVLANLIVKDDVFPADIICQPLEQAARQGEHYSETVVVVLRIHEKLSAEPFL